MIIFILQKVGNFFIENNESFHGNFRRLFFFFFAKGFFDITKKMPIFDESES